jgi:hypothetical protein
MPQEEEPEATMLQIRQFLGTLSVNKLSLSLSSANAICPDGAVHSSSPHQRRAFGSAASG